MQTSSLVWKRVAEPTPQSLVGVPEARSDRASSSAIVLLHGYGASADDLAPLGEVLVPGAEVFCPQGPLSIAIGWGMEGRAWFPIDMEALLEAQAQGGFRDFSTALPKGVEEANALLGPWLRELVQRFEGRVILGGFSQGAMLAADLYFSTPDLGIQALILFSGQLVARERWLQGIKNGARRIPIFQSHGQNDAVLSFEGAKALSGLLAAEGWGNDLEWVPFEGQHEISNEVLERAARFVGRVQSSSKE